MGCTVLLAAEGQSLVLLREAFPSLEWLETPGFKVSYAQNGKVTWSMIRQSPAFLRSIEQERVWLDKFLQKRHVDLIISDNRYGFRHPDCRSVLLTHQLRVCYPSLPLADTLFRRFMRKQLKGFDALWIPDRAQQQNLSGELSRDEALPLSPTYIGPLSRFAGVEDTLPAMKDWPEPIRFLFLVSGPEPAASGFRDALRKQATQIGEGCVLVSGQPGQTGQAVEWVKRGALIEVPHLPGPLLCRAVQQAELVICRSGYSSLMDLAILGKKALLIPTPGQPEQEYLARYYKDMGWAYAVAQSSLDLQRDAIRALSYRGIYSDVDAPALQLAINAELSCIND